MPTKIKYKKLEHKSRLISYCLESPIEVLRQVLPTHKIFQYGSISLPVDPEIDERDDFQPDHGIIIKQATAPRGTQIVQNLSGIDLAVAGAELRSRRNQRDMRLAFREAISQSMSMLLDGFGTICCYLDAYELTQTEGCQDPIYEKKVKQLLEIAEVAFNVQNPTFDYLRRILQR